MTLGVLSSLGRLCRRRTGFRVSAMLLRLVQGQPTTNHPVRNVGVLKHTNNLVGGGHEHIVAGTPNNATPSSFKPDIVPEYPECLLGYKAATEELVD